MTSSNGSGHNGNGRVGLGSLRIGARQIGVLVVGCGHWGRHYVRIFGDLPDTRVVAVCDPSIDQLELIADKFPSVILTQRLEDALALPGIDCAVVATQASTHFEIASRCLEAGTPVLVEKPLTTSHEDADALVEIAERRGLTLMVGHTFVYNAAVSKMREYVDSGALGDIYYMYARRTSLGPIRSDVNALWDLASHDISIFNYLLGTDPEWVSAVGARVLRNEREDVGFVSIGYPGGVVAHVHVSWADPNKTRELVVVGSEKQVVFDDLNTRERVRVFSKGVRMVAPANPTYGEFMFQLRDGDIVSPLIEASEPLKNECVHFIDCLRSGDTPLTDGVVGSRAVRVMEAIDRSIAMGGAPATLAKGHQVGHNGRATAYAVR